MNEEMYVVVRNHEGQYSIWGCERPVPLGWDVQMEASAKETCLQFIRKNWTDMTPLSLRTQEHLA
jgi:MbtH protein